MKIIFPTLGFVMSGGFRYICEVANGLTEKGHEVFILTPLGSKSPFPLTAVQLQKKFLIHHNKYLNFITNTYSLFRTTPKCDILVANYWITAYSSFFSRISRRGIPFYLVQAYEPFFMADRIFEQLAKMSYYLVDNIITNSMWTDNMIYKKTHVIHPGVNTEIFKPLNIKTEKKVIFAVGSNALPLKGFEDFVQSMRIIRKVYPNIEIIVATHENINESRIPIKFVKAQNDFEMARLYSACDVFVSTSWYEGFCLPPLEAMACGAPVVTTDSGGINDYAIHQKNSLIVTPKEPMKIANAVLKILSDDELAKKLRDNGIETANKFPWQKTVDRIEQVFLDALSRN